MVKRVYYPQMVTPTLRERSDAAIAIRKGKMPTHFNGYRGGRVSEDITNLFSGLIYDGTNDGSLFDLNQEEEPENPPIPLPMHQRSAYKGDGRYSPPYLLTKYEVNREQHFIHLANLEKGVLTFFERANWKQIAEEFKTDETREIGVKIDVICSEVCCSSTRCRF